MEIRARRAGRPARFWPALVLALAPLGCSGVEPEPETAFSDLPPQETSFLTLWECSLEAAEREGFEIATSEREGDLGHFVTEFQVVHRDPLADTARGRRLRVRVRAVEPGFAAQVAASEFERRGGGDWSYAGTDARLLDRYRATLRSSLERRFRAEETR